MNEQMQDFPVTLSGLDPDYSGPRLSGNVTNFGFDGLVPAEIIDAAPKKGTDGQGNPCNDMAIEVKVAADETRKDANGSSIAGLTLKDWPHMSGNSSGGKPLNWTFADLLLSAGIFNSVEEMKQRAEMEKTGQVQPTSAFGYAAALKGKRVYVKVTSRKLDKGATASQANGYVTADVFDAAKRAYEAGEPAGTNYQRVQEPLERRGGGQQVGPGAGTNGAAPTPPGFGGGAAAPGVGGVGGVGTTAPAPGIGGGL